MQDIPLSFDDAGKIFLYAQIFGQTIPKPKPLKMYIDTGASNTTISLKDAEELGIDSKNLPSSGKTNYGYGGRMDVRRLSEVCLVFMMADRSTCPVCLNRIQVNYTFSSVKKNDRDIVIYGMPSVLGVDVLLKAGFGLHASWKERTAHLTSG